MLTLITACFPLMMYSPLKVEAGTPEGALDITNKSNLVSINYSLWFDPVVPEQGGTFYDVGEIFKTSGINKTAPVWGPLTAFHYWSKPALGYYRSDNTNVIRTHLTQLEEAGIDFIIMDNTNASSTMDPNYYQNLFVHPATVFLDTMLQMRNEGLSTPHVVFWNGSAASDPNPAYAGNDVYNRFYASGTYDSLFVTYGGKPLMLTTDTLPSSLATHFTLRKMWGLQGSLADKEWSFLQPQPQNVGMNGTQKEQLSVSVAYQANYISDPDSATPRRGGITFATQWQKAFQEKPKVVTLTWWNEWIAQRFEDENGKTRFVDNFTEEYSRDIEPQLGGHGDRYYQYMKRYIADYKADKPFPLGLVDDTVNLGSFETGSEGWKAGANVGNSFSNFSQTGASVPAAYEQYKLLQNESAAVNGDLWHTVYRQFERPVDFSEYEKLSFAINHWGGAPGATSYMANVKLTSQSGQTITKEVATAGAWQQVELDFRSWPYRNEVKRIDIGFRAVGGNQPWAGKFFIDQVQLTSEKYNLGDFEYGTEGWAASSNVTSATATAGGGTNTPAAYNGAQLLNIQGAPVNGSLLRSVKKDFASVQNWSSFKNFKIAVSGWGGAPGATSYTARVKLTSGTGAVWTADYPVPNPSGWQELSLDFSAWAQKYEVKSIEVGYIAVGGNQPWAGKFFLDGARLTKT